VKNGIIVILHVSRPSKSHSHPSAEREQADNVSQTEINSEFRSQVRIPERIADKVAAP